jgi:hypothetical protein
VCQSTLARDSEPPRQHVCARTVLNSCDTLLPTTLRVKGHTSYTADRENMVAHLGQRSCQVASAPATDQLYSNVTALTTFRRASTSHTDAAEATHSTSVWLHKYRCRRLRRRQRRDHAAAYAGTAVNTLLTARLRHRGWRHSRHSLPPPRPFTQWKGRGARASASAATGCPLS